MYPPLMGLRARVVALVVVLAGLVPAACGSSSGSPSPLDPAQIAPTNSAVYAEFTVRPQGSQRDDVEKALTKLLGHSPDAGIQRLVNRSLGKDGLNYQRDVQPWLGQRVGLVVTAFSRTGFALIAPTSNTGAALATLTRDEKRHGTLTSGAYRGVSYKQVVGGTTSDVFGIVGHYAVVGAGPGTFDDIVDASKGSGLNGQPAFTTAMAALPSSSLIRAYANTPLLLGGLESLPSVSPQMKQALRTAGAQGKVGSALTLSLAAGSSAFTLDAHSSGGTPSGQRSSADVGGLPGQSWLAISTGAAFSKTASSALERSVLSGVSGAAATQGVNPSALLNGIQQRLGVSVQDLISALGGFALSVQGTSVATVGAGMVLHPQNPQAAVRVLAAVRGLLARNQGLSVSGSDKSFTVTKPGLPIPRGVVSDTGREVVATLDLPNFAALLAPSSTLSTNAAYQRAKAQLPTGSNVPLFVDFGPIATLLGSLPQFQQQPKDKQALATVQRMDYFVVGFSSVTHDFRMILGLR